MINRYRLQKILAPTAGLRKPIAAGFFGLLILLFGIGLSFLQYISPFLDGLRKSWDTLALRFVAANTLDQFNHVLGGICLVLGGYLTFLGIRNFQRRFYEVVNPDKKSDRMVNVFVRRQMLTAGPRIVALGGGTGLSTLLRGLKQHSSNITAIVTVTDDGGSSGRLSKEMGIIPPGDMRNCLVALADAEKLMTDLFQHRFRGAKGTLGGHSVGNLLIAGLVDQCGGDLERALNMASEVLNIRGRVVPSTLDHVKLRAILEDGSETVGETDIVQSGKRIRRIFLDPAEVTAFQDALIAIEEADLIVIGPGSVYTSVIPNLLVPGISEAIHDASAVKVYVCNVMTQQGESDSFTAAEHVAAIRANVGHPMFDYVMVNVDRPSETTVDKYRGYGQFVVEPDIDRIRAMGLKIVSGNFMNESDFVRHDPLKIARRLMDLLTR